jgi:hypothetical protein
VCNECPSMMTGSVREAKLQVDNAMRRSYKELGLYFLCICAIVVIMYFLFNWLYRLYRQWRVMAATVDPPLDKYIVGSFENTGDDEIYQQDLYDQRPVASYGEKIERGMAALESTYGEYNKQIKKYSKDVLKKAPEDIIDRGVLDRDNDDFPADY